MAILVIEIPEHYNPVYYSYDLSVNQPYFVSPVSSVTESDNSYKKFQQDHILTYKKDFGEHHLTATWWVYHSL